ncbi:MAG TPA: CDP-alcohol phosphatidyltransferase family protein [Bacteroidota bacterium]|nr:CDP-alcohol phosphatidyltransferase family protein [Bacteroidota bacterium]
MSKKSDGILDGLITLFHERLGLSPNQISAIGFVIGLVAALLVGLHFLLTGLIVMALSQIVDGLDGGVARKYHLQSDRGQMLEVVFDRLNELTMFLALAVTEYVTYGMAALAFSAILLVTVVEPKSKFDPGFKRFMLYFGYLVTLIFQVKGFQIAMHVIFFANLIGFAVGTILVDYRLQAEIDAQAILRREREVALGIPQPPDDPPSFLSKLFS